MQNTFIEPDGSVERVQQRKRRYTTILLMRISYLNIFLLICSIKLLVASPGKSQGIENTNVNLEFHHAPLKSIFEEIEKQTDFFFIVASEKISTYTQIDLPKRTYTVKEALDLALKGTGLKFRQERNYILIFLSEQSISEMLEAAKSKDKFLTTVTGTVRDADTEQPLSGVNIIVKGTTKGTTTDAAGRFAIDVEDNEDVLLFSFIGFKNFETEVSGRSVLEVVMEIDIKSLQEVEINAGYYNVSEREKTGSISKVSAEVISKQPVTNPLAALQGRMPGVYIQQASGVPGGDFNILIRGQNSLRDGGNQPLYMIDGVPFSTEKTFSSYTDGNFGFTLGSGDESGNYGVSMASPLTSINPSDIESIEILKDADATAIYGSRGANGVVLITTKKGKVGKTTFDLTLYSGVGKTRTSNLLNTKQFLSLRREAFSNDGIVPTRELGSGYSPELMIWDTTRYTDWQNILIRPAQTTSIQSSISGGTESTQFLFSLGYRKENSVYPGNFAYQKGSFHLSVNHQSTNKKFRISINLNGTKDNNDLPRPSVSFNSAARVLAPNAPSLYDKNGNLNWENSTWRNPIADAKQRYNNQVINFTGNSTIGYEILSNFLFKTNVGFSFLESAERTIHPHTSRDPSNGWTSANSEVNISGGSNQSWTIEPQFNWEKKIAKGKLTLLIGTTIQGQQLKRRADNYKGFPSNALLDNLASASSTFNYEFVQSEYRYNAFFGRLNYNWDGKYILNFTGRRDGSSRFGPGKQFANFGAIGIAWIFSSENFLKVLNSHISFGKLRVSYGSTGSDQIGNYQYLDTYATNSSTNLSDQYQGVTWISPTKLFNFDYAWEVNKKFEVALEIGFLNDRISLVTSYFNNRSSNQLVNFTLPQTTGFTSLLANLPATVENSGIEVEATIVTLQSSPIKWTTSFNLTIPKNELIEFPNLESSAYANHFVVGKPLSITKVYESTGVNSETGLWTFLDVNRDGVISQPEDNKKLTFIGQDLYGGFNNTLTFRSWSLDIFFQFVKQTGFNNWYTRNVMPGQAYNIPSSIIDKKIWRQSGDIADIQRLYSSATNNAEADRAFNNYSNSDAAISDASFISLKNISLSYSLPQQWLKNIKCRLYFQGQNQLIITEYEGDPENQNSGNLAPLKMLTIGAQITL